MTAGRLLNMRLDDTTPICTSGKRGFPDEKTAAGQLDAARRRRAQAPGYKPGRVETRTYECPSCKAWHLTAKPKR